MSQICPLSLMEKYTQQCWLFCVSERNQLNDKMAAACLTGLGRSALQSWIGTMLVFHHLILDVIHIIHLIFDEFLLWEHWILLLQSLFTVWRRKKQLDFTHVSHVGEKQTRGLFSWAASHTIEESDSYYPRSASFIFIWSVLRLETVQSLVAARASTILVEKVTFFHFRCTK